MTFSEHDILDFVAENPSAGRNAIHKGVARDASETTVWRVLKRLVDEGRLEVSGRGRATGYQIAGSAVVRAHLSVPYNRRPPIEYQAGFLDAYIPGKTWYLSQAERDRMLEAGRPHGGVMPAGTYARGILEQLLVDLSWASSRMEGNTYDVLQTERLIRFGEEADGKNRKEALMILNHKDAIQYVVENLEEISLRRHDLFSVHALLSDGLLADPTMSGRLRAMPVGISHSSYRPLDDAVAIQEEFDILIHKFLQIRDPFEQSFFLLVHMPYLQAFADVNKRTSRVVSNIPLLKSGLAPMSFTTMDDRAYIDGLIGVYELNNVSLFREVCIDAYLASAEKYRILRADVESPEKAALTYREFVRAAVHRCVVEFKEFRHEEVRAMAAEAGVPEADRDEVVAYVKEQLTGLHEGNVIRFRLKAEDLEGVNLF